VLSADVSMVTIHCSVAFVDTDSFWNPLDILVFTVHHRDINIWVFGCNSFQRHPVTDLPKILGNTTANFGPLLTVPPLKLQIGLQSFSV